MRSPAASRLTPRQLDALAAAQPAFAPYAIIRRRDVGHCRVAAHSSADTPPRLQPEALKALLDYSFPGNVRELENILERAVALCEDGVIERGDLMLIPAGTGRTETAASAGPGPDAAAAGETAPGPQSLDDMVTTLEREKIMQTLQKTRFNKTAAARELGITFRALRYKLKKLGID